MSAAWITASVALVALVCGGIAWVSRTVWRIASRTSRFLDSYFGTANHAGVIDRLVSLEHNTTALLQETRPNGGASLHDAMVRMEHSLEMVRTEQAELRRRVEFFETRGEERRNNA